jgi:RimJ/RimL family protein N-acetyltransferase
VRTGLVLAGREVVDGLGAWRVVRTWEMAQRHAHRRWLSGRARASDPESSTTDSLEVERSKRLVARAATLRDARLLWEWRNDPVTRASSRSSGELPWEDHLQWVTASLSRTDRRLLIVEGPGGTDGSVVAVGTVRWDLEGERGPAGDWEVSITVAPDLRGQSLARSVLGAAELALTEMARSDVARSSRTAVTAYLAVVHVDNQASLRLFETSGYLPDLPPDSRGFMRFRKAARVP